MNIFLLLNPPSGERGGEREGRRERENRRNGNYVSREREKGKRHCSSGTLIGLVRTIMGLPLPPLSSGSLRAGKIFDCLEFQRIYSDFESWKSQRKLVRDSENEVVASHFLLYDSLITHDSPFSSFISLEFRIGWSIWSGQVWRVRGNMLGLFIPWEKKYNLRIKLKKNQNQFSIDK